MPKCRAFFSRTTGWITRRTASAGSADAASVTCSDIVSLPCVGCLDVLAPAARYRPPLRRRRVMPSQVSQVRQTARRMPIVSATL